jgi:hypothetical protein
VIAGSGASLAGSLWPRSQEWVLPSAVLVRIQTVIGKPGIRATIVTGSFLGHALVLTGIVRARLMAVSAFACFLRNMM